MNDMLQNEVDYLFMCHVLQWDSLRPHGEVIRSD
jgi:hypothetical protein